MPVYEFHCNECEQDFDITLKMIDLHAGVAACPHCESKNLRRVFSPSSIRFPHPDEKKLGKDIRDLY